MRSPSEGEEGKDVGASKLQATASRLQSHAGRENPRRSGCKPGKSLPKKYFQTIFLLPVTIYTSQRLLSHVRSCILLRRRENQSKRSKLDAVIHCRMSLRSPSDYQPRPRMTNSWKPLAVESRSRISLLLINLIMHGIESVSIFSFVNY